MWKRFEPEQPIVQTTRHVPVDALLLIASAAAMWAAHRTNQSQLPVFPVAGQFSFEEQATPGAVIALYPIARTTESASLVRPRGTVDADGRFSLTTYDVGDGAPVGEYAVTVTWRPRVVAGEDYNHGPNVLPDRYARPETTPLRIKISAQANNLPPLKIVVGHEFGPALVNN